VADNRPPDPLHGLRAIGGGVDPVARLTMRPWIAPSPALVGPVERSHPKPLL